MCVCVSRPMFLSTFCLNSDRLVLFRLGWLSLLFCCGVVILFCCCFVVCSVFRGWDFVCVLVLVVYFCISKVSRTSLNSSLFCMQTLIFLSKLLLEKNV